MSRVNSDRLRTPREESAPSVDDIEAAFRRLHDAAPFDLRPWNLRPAPVVQVVGSHVGPDYTLSYLSCGHSTFCEDGALPLAEGELTSCFKCLADPPIIPFGAVS